MGVPPQCEGWFDRAQLEQVLINVLKNAHESGGPAEAVELEVQRRGDELRLEVRDRGSGMGEAVLAQALLPFYSTKRSGTGLGLAWRAKSPKPTAAASPWPTAGRRSRRQPEPASAFTAAGEPAGPML